MPSLYYSLSFKIIAMKSQLLILSCLIFLNACSQTNSKKSNAPVASDVAVGGRCEGCEAIYETSIPFEELKATDTLPDYHDKGPRIVVSGTIYKPDGKTPAPGVILYVYHTDQAGIYPKKGDEKGWAKRHGYIRGWIKTDANGRYAFYTLVPASYPNSTNPKHIHPIIKEPGKTAYWVDEFLFADDPLLPANEKNKVKPVGGNGVLTTTNKNGMLYANRDIILGLNVSEYR
jgi:protocatechuate 3,4-dioxygenase, beta subunit